MSTTSAGLTTAALRLEEALGVRGEHGARVQAGNGRAPFARRDLDQA
jgi:hypothetical protein